MEVPPLPMIIQEEKTESLKIKQGKENYILNIKTEENSLEFKICENEKLDSFNYIRKMSLNEIKQINNSFLGLNSCKEFSDFIKTLIKRNKLKIKQYEENISLNFYFDLLFKQQSVEIILLVLKKY